jgi:hypothetical protein
MVGERNKSYSSCMPNYAVYLQLVPLVLCVLCRRSGVFQGVQFQDAAIIEGIVVFQEFEEGVAMGFVNCACKIIVHPPMNLVHPVPLYWPPYKKGDIPRTMLHALLALHCTALVQPCTMLHALLALHCTALVQPFACTVAS